MKTTREIVAYLTIAYLLALAIALGLPHAHLNLLLSVMVPTVTVGILTFTVTPRGSRRALWRGIGLSRAGFRSWPAAVVVPLLLCGGAYGTALLVGAGTLHLGRFSAGWLVDLVIALVVPTAIILGEEIGWRGYLLPRFQQLTGRRRAAVVTGFAHGCFHLPLILIATTYDTGGARWIVAPCAVLTITAAGVLYAWLWDRSKTVWPVAIAHNVANTVFDLGASAVVATSGSSLAYVAGETGFATLGACAVMALVLLRWSRVWRTPAASTEPQPVQAVRA
ncbi:CPBP family intramembrane metalloprotease [Kribbella jejuensis]|uniref:CAAX prenyl protease-like protein n=1 Tax=Kribbella jejuensis TaxID=236068 RepID=A0A542ENW2_9ACTN|nr:CPBP family intramembrane glutamic endopeptidase [Kribbella jejuensis]TQJ17040.1 CAAX prenyl protease-like protein [Kribbella jejuensis]